MCWKRYHEFLNAEENKIIPCWYDGIILGGLKRFFNFLSKLSWLRYKIWLLTKANRSTVDRYKYVDRYSIFCLVMVITFFTLLALTLFYFPKFHWIFWIPFIFIFYRLFDILQSWVSQFVLGGVPKKWNPINNYRSLVLVFMGYLEITISYAFIALFFKESFRNMKVWQQAIYYSFRNAVTIGSDYHPANVWGLVIFITQIGFAILFLTAVVSRIMSHDK